MTFNKVTLARYFNNFNLMVEVHFNGVTIFFYGDGLRYGGLSLRRVKNYTLHRAIESVFSRPFSVLVFVWVCVVFCPCISCSIRAPPFVVHVVSVATQSGPHREILLPSSIRAPPMRSAQ